MWKLINKIETHKIIFLTINLFISILLFITGSFIRSKTLDYVNIVESIIFVNLTFVGIYFLAKIWIKLTKNWIIYELSPYIAEKITPIILMGEIGLVVLIPFFSEVYFVCTTIIPWYLLLNIEIKKTK